MPGARGDVVLKLYRSELRNPLFRNDPDLEATCLRALQHTGFVPKLRATGSSGGDNWVLYDHAPGVPWHQDTASVGRLMAELHAMPTPVSAPAGCNGSADLAGHTERILAGCLTERRQELENLRPQRQVAPSPRTCLVHADPVPGNILVSHAGLTLIDWQCPVLGDPCEDIALFLSPAMQRLYRGYQLSDAEEEAFHDAYDNAEVTTRYRALHPWYAWRMAAYCLWRAENGTPDYFFGLELELATL